MATHFSLLRRVACYQIHRVKLSTTHAAPFSTVAMSTPTPSSVVPSAHTATTQSHIAVPRSSVDFFAQAAPKLHEYVRALQKENEALRAQNTQLRADGEILDGISDFLREMSKTDLNYKQFMAAKTAEVEAAKLKQSNPPQPPLVAPKELPPVQVKPVAAPTATATKATSTASSSKSPVQNVDAGMFSGMGGFFNKSQQQKVINSSTKPSAANESIQDALSIPPPTASPSAPAVSSSSPQRHQSHHHRAKKSQKRPPLKPAGEDAIYSFTPASPAEHNPPLRHVTPYPHEYHVYAKKRWLGRTLLEVLVSDFRVASATTGEEENEDGDEDIENDSPIATTPEEHYRQSILSGLVTVNGKQVMPEYILKDKDHLVHITHKHEPPVLDDRPDHSIEILADTPDLLVVNKPCGMPVHESGVYRHNTLLGVLWSQVGTKSMSLFPVHRLDKLTSGVVLLAKNKETAAIMGARMKFKDESSVAAVSAVVQAPDDTEERKTSEQEDASEALLSSTSITQQQHPTLGQTASKIYLARVTGKFPQNIEVKGLTKVDSNAAADDTDDGSNAHRRTTYLLDGPIRTVSLRKGIHEVNFSLGKPSKTLFIPLSYDVASNTSLLQCQPLTGRTHQIRLHLQYLSHPICNDPVYGPGAFEGNTFASPATGHPDPLVRAQKTPAFQPGCISCETNMYYNRSRDAGRRYATGIWLHAWKYAFGSSENSSAGAAAEEYSTSRPDWAQDGFDVLKGLGRRVKTSARAIDSLKANGAVSPGASSSPPAASSSASPPPPPVHIRASTTDDLPAIHAIYAHWVLKGTGTFEEVPPTLEEMRTRREELLKKGMPYLVATVPSGENARQDKVVGYAYAGHFRPRTAYRFTLEDSIYIHPDYCNRTGVGSKLLAELLEITTKLGFAQMLAVIGDSSNAASIGLHKRYRFVHEGVMHDVGYKFGKWLDVVIMQRVLNADVAKEPKQDPKRFEPEAYVYAPGSTIASSLKWTQPQARGKKEFA